MARLSDTNKLLENLPDEGPLRTLRRNLIVALAQVELLEVTGAIAARSTPKRRSRKASKRKARK